MAIERTPVEWAVQPLKKFAVFSGRAPRAEYWWYALMAGIASLMARFLDGLVDGPMVGLYGPWSLVLTVFLIVPGLAVAARRLHDINRSAWWLLLKAGSYGMIIGGAGNWVIPASIEAMGGLTLGITLLAFAVASIVLFVFMVTPGTEGPNRFGRDPYGPDHLEEVFA